MYWDADHFNPLFPYGKRRRKSEPVPGIGISIHSSHTGRDSTVPSRRRCRSISIHSSHTGRDEQQAAPAPAAPAFQSTLPIREETAIKYGNQYIAVFQSTLPIREETCYDCFMKEWRKKISIHSSHTGRDPIRSRKRSAGQISIHSSHTGRDPHNDDDRPNDGISIHSSHTGRDLGVQVVGGLGTDFNPLFPYGKRRGEAMTVIDLSRFQSTLPIREETNSTTSTAWGWEDFNPLFPYGKRPRGQHPNSLANLFQSTLPIREETALGVIRRWMEEFQSTLPIREET